MELKKTSVLLLGRGTFVPAHKLITLLCILVSVFTATFYKLNYFMSVVSYIHCIKCAAVYGCNAIYNNVAPGKAIQLALFNIVLLRCIAMVHAWTRILLVSCSVVNYAR